MAESKNPFSAFDSEQNGNNQSDSDKKKSEKKLYWIKLKDNFFDDQYIRMIRATPNGYRTLCIYLTMQLKALKTEGLITYKKMLPNFADELSFLLNEDSKAVSEAIDILTKFGLIELWDGDKLLMTAQQQIIESGSEGASAERVRRFREKRKNS